MYQDNNLEICLVYTLLRFLFFFFSSSFFFKGAFPSGGNKGLVVWLCMSYFFSFKACCKPDNLSERTFKLDYLRMRAAVSYFLRLHVG